MPVTNTRQFLPFRFRNKPVPLSDHSSVIGTANSSRLALKANESGMVSDMLSDRQQAQTMKTQSYFWQGTERQTLRVNWLSIPRGYMVRRESSRGFITGHLTDRLGWGKPELANVFQTAQAAADAAAKTGVRFFQVLWNAREIINKTN